METRYSSSLSLSSKLFQRPAILLSIGKFLNSTELCRYSKLSTSIHAIWCYHHSPYSQFFITQISQENKKTFSGNIKCSVTESGLKFEWRCTKKEYETLLQEYSSDQFIECEAFEEPKTKTKWFIEIFPNGYHLSKNGYAAIFLTMEWKPKHIKEVRARLLCHCPQVNLKFSDGVTYDWKKFSKGKHNAFKINDVLNNNYIVLTIELIIIDITESETKINCEMKEQIDEMHNKILHLQSRMDEIDSIHNRLFNIEKLLHKIIIFQQDNIQHNNDRSLCNDETDHHPDHPDHPDHLNDDYGCMCQYHDQHDDYHYNTINSKRDQELDRTIRQENYLQLMPCQHY